MTKIFQKKCRDSSRMMMLFYFIFDLFFVFSLPKREKQLTVHIDLLSRFVRHVKINSVLLAASFTGAHVFQHPFWFSLSFSLLLLVAILHGTYSLAFHITTPWNGNLKSADILYFLSMLLEKYPLNNQQTGGVTSDGTAETPQFTKHVNTIHPEPEIHEQIYMTKGYGTLCTTTSTFSLTLSAL